MNIQQILSQALLAHQAFDFAKAQQGYLEVLRQSPGEISALHLLGVLHHQQGDPARAIELINQAIELAKPKISSFIVANSIDEAMKAGRQPFLATFYSNLGEAYRAAQQLDRAEKAYQQAIFHDPSLSAAWSNLGFLFHQQGAHDRAFKAWQDGMRAIAAGGGQPLEQLNSCQVAQAVGQLDEVRRGEIAAIANMIGCAEMATGQILAARQSFRQAVEFDPPRSAYFSNQLLVSLYDQNLDNATLAADHSSWDLRFPSAAPEFKFFSRSLRTSKKLRVGYVSPDFCGHAVNAFFEGFFSHHDRDSFEIFLYAHVDAPDAVTQRLAKQADGWRDIRPLDDRQLANLVYQDQIDVLVDLAGHTAGNRLPAFAMRPAPIQLSYLGYPHDTGLQAIPYRIVDRMVEPEDGKCFRPQACRYLDPCFCCFQPTNPTPVVNPLPALQNGFVTFGSLHGLFKLNRSVINLWIEILKAVPDSRLLIYRDTIKDKIAKRLRDEFGRLGIDSDRIVVIGELESSQTYLDVYHQIDITLDTFPWSGHTTCTESLWMGIPVVTLYGQRHASRLASSVLNAINQRSWIAHSPTEYIHIATQLAKNLPSLAKNRLQLREQMQQSILCDTAQFAQKIEGLYQQLWHA